MVCQMEVLDDKNSKVPFCSASPFYCFFINIPFRALDAFDLYRSIGPYNLHRTQITFLWDERL